MTQSAVSCVGKRGVAGAASQTIRQRRASVANCQASLPSQRPLSRCRLVFTEHQYLTTTSPPPQHVSRFMTVWLGLLPLGLVTLLGWQAVPAMAAISFALLGIDEIGLQVRTRHLACCPSHAPCVPQPRMGNSLGARQVSPHRHIVARRSRSRSECSLSNPWSAPHQRTWTFWSGPGPTVPSHDDTRSTHRGLVVTSAACRFGYYRSCLSTFRLLSSPGASRVRTVLPRSRFVTPATSCSANDVMGSIRDSFAINGLDSASPGVEFHGSTAAADARTARQPQRD